MATTETAPAAAEPMPLPCEASFSSSTPTDTDASSSSSSSNNVSLTSTPPTTASPDSISLASELDCQKDEAAAVPTVEAAIPTPEADQHDQHAQRDNNRPQKQTTASQDAIVVAGHQASAEPLATSRPRRARATAPVYNLAKLVGTDVHGRRRAKGDIVQGKKRRRTVSDATQVEAASTSASEPIDVSKTLRSSRDVEDTKASAVSKKIKKTDAPTLVTRRATRSSGLPLEDLTTKLAALSKRGKKAIEKELKSLPRELRRLQDTNEFAHIDTRPVRYTIWSNGKYVDVDSFQATSSSEPPRKRAKIEKSPEATDNSEPERNSDQNKETKDKQNGQDKQGPRPIGAIKPRPKKWLEKGLYAGQEYPADIMKTLTAPERKKLLYMPELMPSGKPNKVLPLPMYNGFRLLLHGRDFKLPYDICHPLPPGQPKPAAYRTMTKNRFVGDAAAYWKKNPHFGDFASKCVCKPEDGCGETCQNRIMLYECDETNCNIGKEYCTNRAFQELQERTKKGGRYRIGVEVFKTPDRGYGVRSNRCFEPNQIIMEYTGEIITEEECERRMREEYKDNECYYLMSFDQNMIIDATSGSIARFVNHSCSPNCRMIKWIVKGQPRMALFAGDRPIITGEELTYDYNFDPFCAKNVQKCLCGSANCRGVLGPKPKEVKPPKKEDKQQMKKGKKGKKPKASATKMQKPDGQQKEGKSTRDTKLTDVSARRTKRKLKDAFEFDADDEDDGKSTKKRKTKTTTGKGSQVHARKQASATAVAKGRSKAVTSAKTAAKRIIVKSTVAKSTVTELKRSVSSSVSVTSKPTTKTRLTLTPRKRPNTAIRIKAASSRQTKAGKAGLTKGYSKKKTATADAAAKSSDQPQSKAAASNRSPGMTIIAAGISTDSPNKENEQQEHSEKPDALQSQDQGLLCQAIDASPAAPTLKMSSRKVIPSRKALEAAEIQKAKAAAKAKKTAAAKGRAAGAKRKVSISN